MLWRKAMPAPVWVAPSFADGRLYVAIGKGSLQASDAEPYGEVRCLDPGTGEGPWSASVTEANRKSSS